jgi:protein-disulfide isomerase
MTGPNRRTVLLAGLAAGAVPIPAIAQGAPEFYPVPVELLEGLEQLPGRVTLGNPKGDVHLVEFFDYNCPFCRRSAAEVRPLIAGDRELKYTLVNFAVLGIPSIGATRVALAFSRQRANRYLEFHEQMFRQRGTLSHVQAIAIAKSLGAEEDKLLEDADSDPVTDAMKASVALGDQYGFRATPSFLVGRDAVSGYLNLPAKKIAIASFRQCERAVCG